MDNTTILDELFATARTYESALAIALRVGDEMVASASATRLREALDHASTVAGNFAAAAGSPTRRAALRDMYLASTIGMQELLRRRLPTPCSTDPDRCYRWAAERDQTKVARGGPHVFELNSNGRDLQNASFHGLHVSRSKFLTDLRDATLVDAFIERCDFTYARLERTIWQRTCITHSFYRDALFGNATLDDVAFFDCDLRDADFSLFETRGATMSSTQFIRCDLRGSRWVGRDLSSAGSTIEFINCQLHGMVCDSNPRSVSRADISPQGDGSWVMGMC